MSKGTQYRWLVEPMGGKLLDSEAERWRELAEEWLNDQPGDDWFNVTPAAKGRVDECYATPTERAAPPRIMRMIDAAYAYATETMMRDDPIMSPREVAERRGCTHRTVQLAVRSGRLPGEIIRNGSGKIIRYQIRRSDADRWSPLPVGKPRKNS